MQSKLTKSQDHILLSQKIQQYRITVPIFLVLLLAVAAQTQEPVTVGRIKYGGGGDWYGNRTTFVNLFNYVKDHTRVNVAEKEKTVQVEDKDLFNFPIIYMAGHGNIKFSEKEVSRLRKYLENGGFLWADDDYGMDKSFRREMKKVFPELDWTELPYSFPIYHTVFEFPNGLPKIHKHDGGPPHGLGLFYEGRLVAFYSFNTDISDGCEDADIHNDPQQIREKALKMGTNILVYALIENR